MRTKCAAGATTGILTVGTFLLHTIERAWVNNQPDVSCVPAGEYQLIPYLSPRHGQTWRLHNPALMVWGLSSMAPEGMRTEVEIHPGNLASESEGCLLVGMAPGEMLDPKTHQVEPAVLDSDIAFEHLRDLLDGTTEEDSLIIERSGLYAEQLL